MRKLVRGDFSYLTSIPGGRGRIGGVTYELFKFACSRVTLGGA